MLLNVYTNIVKPKFISSNPYVPITIHQTTTSPATTARANGSKRPPPSAPSAQGIAGSDAYEALRCWKIWMRLNFGHLEKLVDENPMIPKNKVVELES